MSGQDAVEPHEEEAELSRPSTPTEDVAAAPVPSGTPTREPGYGGYGVPPFWAS